jgi:hypothetical protein
LLAISTLVLLGAGPEPKNVRFADRFAGADACAKINNAILSGLFADVVVDARGLTGVQGCASNPFANVAVGGVLNLGEAVFVTTTTISVPTNWTINCAYGGRSFGRGDNFSPGGTVFLWIGGPNTVNGQPVTTPVFKLFNTHHQQIFGCTIDGDTTAKSVGFLLDANNPKGKGVSGLHNVYIDHYNCYRLLNCIQVGTDETNTFEIDKWAFEFGHVESGMPGSAAILLLEAGNIGDDSSIDKLWTMRTDIGVDLSYSVVPRLTDISCGDRVSINQDNNPQDNPCIKVVARGNLTIIGGESESADPYTTDIHLISSGSCLSDSTVILINRTVVNPVVVDQCPTQLVSIGSNTFGGNPNFGSTPVSIKSISRSGGVVTVNTGAAHGLCASLPSPPQLTCAVIVSDTTGAIASFTGQFIVSTITPPAQGSTQFMYQQPGVDEIGTPSIHSTSQKSLGIVNGNSALRLTSIAERMNYDNTTGIINGWTIFDRALVTQLGTFATLINCSSSLSPAACAAAPGGSFILPAGATSITVNTTAVTDTSQITLQEDASLGVNLRVTCDRTAGRTYAISSRISGTSFTITASAAPMSNPACLTYSMIN